MQLLKHSRRDFLKAAAGACTCALCGGANARVLKYELVATEVESKTWVVHGQNEYFSFENGGNIVNTAFIEVPEGVVVIDTGPSKRFGDQLLELIGQKIPGKPVLRVYNTHHHPDHFLGNQVFDPAIIAAPQGVIDNIESEGDAMTDNLYRLLGDWMRGTDSVAPTQVLDASSENIGGRDFSLLYMSGHTSSDFVIRDDQTGVLFSGDLLFMFRAPTTPHANIGDWRQSLAMLRDTDRDLIVPGHGPGDEKGESIDQTLDWLDWLDGSLRDAVERGWTMNEAMRTPIPPRFSNLAVGKTEFERSVVHLYQAYEDQLMPAIEIIQ